MKVTKNKNIMTFDCGDGEKPYTLDINTATMFGRNGRALKHVPKELCDYFWEQYNCSRFNKNWIIRLFAVASYYGKENIDALLGQDKKMRLADKMNSLGYVYNYSSNQKIWDYLIENENDFIKAISKNPNLGLSDFIRDNIFENLFKKFDIKKETFSTQELEFIRMVIIDNYEANCYPLAIKYFDYLCYYVKQGLAEIAFSMHGIYSFEITLESYFNMCEALGIAPEKTIFTKTFSSIYTLFQDFKEQWTQERLLKYNQTMTEKLFFESDYFTTIIPSSLIDFHKEAVEQNSCVERLYMQKVIDGKTNIVFIRKKDNPQKPYITCEVSNSGRITQFLCGNNYRVTEKEALTFKEEYQKFLMTTMGR